MKTKPKGQHEGTAEKLEAVKAAIEAEKELVFPMTDVRLAKVCGITSKQVFYARQKLGIGNYLERFEEYLKESRNGASE